MTSLEIILERFDRGVETVESDPDGFRQKMDDELIAEKGQEWFDEHKSQQDADWEGVRALIGL